MDILLARRAQTTKELRLQATNIIKKFPTIDLDTNPIHNSIEVK